MERDIDQLLEKLTGVRDSCCRKYLLCMLRRDKIVLDDALGCFVDMRSGGFFSICLFRQVYQG